tara:strand:+ start:1564 stop:1800 length:237 start_codon:yes stop_codon:yes gene_type:complete
MKTIKNIIYNLRNEENQEFDIFNNKLDMQWTLRFEFIDGDIVIMINNSTLTATWFESIEEVKTYLSNSFLNNKNYELF